MQGQKKGLQATVQQLNSELSYIKQQHLDLEGKVSVQSVST
jgi:hypothetical protein